MESPTGLTVIVVGCFVFAAVCLWPVWVFFGAILYGILSVLF